MSYWGKLLGGVAGFVLGGPVGAVMGAAMGHAADEGRLPKLDFGQLLGGPLDAARLASSLGSRAGGVVVRAPKLGKGDGPVNRAEIDAFKRQFRIPPEAVRDIGRLFDSARDDAAGFEPYARELGRGFADNKGLLEDILAALFAIARADTPLTVAAEPWTSSPGTRPMAPPPAAPPRTGPTTLTPCRAPRATPATPTCARPGCGRCARTIRTRWPPAA